MVSHLSIQYLSILGYCLYWDTISGTGIPSVASQCRQIAAQTHGRLAPRACAPRQCTHGVGGHAAHIQSASRVCSARAVRDRCLHARHGVDVRPMEIEARSFQMQINLSQIVVRQAIHHAQVQEEGPLRSKYSRPPTAISHISFNAGPVSAFWASSAMS